jgi:hypothetical protein
MWIAMNRILAPAVMKAAAAVAALLAVAVDYS